MMNTQQIRFAAIAVLYIALLFTAPLLIKLVSQLP
jgi:hypothetical protein